MKVEVKNVSSSGVYLDNSLGTYEYSNFKVTFLSELNGDSFQTILDLKYIFKGFELSDEELEKTIIHTILVSTGLNTKFFSKVEVTGFKDIFIVYKELIYSLKLNYDWGIRFDSSERFIQLVESYIQGKNFYINDDIMWTKLRDGYYVAYLKNDIYLYSGYLKTKLFDNIIKFKMEYRNQIEEKKLSIEDADRLTNIFKLKFLT